VRVVRIFRLAGRTGVGDDARNRAFHVLGATEQRNGVVVAFGHFAAIKAWQCGHALFDQRFRHGEKLFAIAEQVVKALANVTGHFNVLDLVTTDRHLVCVEHQNVGCHQYRVAVQPHGDARIRVFAVFQVLVDRRLVGVRTVEQALGRHAGQQPGQLRDFRDIRLAIERHTLNIETGCQPGRCDFLTRALNAQRVIAFDQGVIVGQKVERVSIGVAAGYDCRANGPGVVAQVRRTGGGDTGEDTSTSGHG